jgi:predicted transcriptional regulator YheO
MLCINLDDSRYRELSNKLMGLCHPDMFVDDVVLPAAPEKKSDAPEKFRNSTEAVAIDAINRELERLGVTAERLTGEERLKIINNLEANGIFLLKGAVKDVATGLCCSQASVYRYLSQVKKDNT